MPKLELTVLRVAFFFLFLCAKLQASRRASRSFLSVYLYFFIQPHVKMVDADSAAGSPIQTPEAVSSEHGSPKPAPPTPNKVSSPVSDREEGEEEDEDNSSKSRAKSRDAHGGNGDDDDGNSEDDLLSDVDEDQFEDYDPATAYIEERPITIDEEAARGLKSAKRKRSAGDGKAQKARDARRDKKRRPAIGDDEDDRDAGPGDNNKSDGPKRSRRPHGGETSVRRKKSPSPEVNEEDLSPEERRKRALDRAINLAIRNPNKRRRKQDEEVCSRQPFLTHGATAECRVLMCLFRISNKPPTRRLHNSRSGWRRPVWPILTRVQRADRR